MIRTLGFIGVLLLVGCSGENTQVGTGEPFRIHAPAKVSWAAQFVKGELPGSPPPPEKSPAGPPAPSAEGGAPKPDNGPNVIKVLSFSTPNPIYQGQGNVGITSGDASSGSYSVGLKLDGIGTGYWVVPVGAPDFNFADGTLTWEAVADFEPSIPAGYRYLQAVPFDEQGNAGQQKFNKVCIASASTAPNDFNACNHQGKLPEAVISLSWDTNVDLDLQVLTPSGRFVDSKHPTAQPPSDAGVIPTDTAYIDRDSNAGCSVDGIRRENLIFPHGAPPHGVYGIYANLFDACKQSSVRFTVSVYSAKNGEDGGDRHLATFLEKSGELLDFQANGGVGRGLFVSEFKFQ